MNSVSEFDNAIAKLDEHIDAGFNVLSDVIDNENDAKRNNELRDDIYKQIVIGYAKWITPTVKDLQSLTDRRYYTVILMNNDLDLSEAVKGAEAAYLFMVSKFSKQLDALKDIVIMLEERRGVFIRQEIARQEHDQAHRYWLTYNSMSGLLTLNDKFDIAKTNLDSPADKILQQAFDNPNKIVEITGITKGQIPTALRDMKITGNLKNMFFPRTSANKVMLRPYITNAEFFAEGLEDFSVRSNEK